MLYLPFFSRAGEISENCSTLEIKLDNKTEIKVETTYSPDPFLEPPLISIAEPFSSLRTSGNLKLKRVKEPDIERLMRLEEKDTFAVAFLGRKAFRPAGMERDASLSFSYTVPLFQGMKNERGAIQRISIPFAPAFPFESGERRTVAVFLRVRPGLTFYLYGAGTAKIKSGTGEVIIEPAFGKVLEQAPFMDILVARDNDGARALSVFYQATGRTGIFYPEYEACRNYLPFDGQNIPEEVYRACLISELFSLGFENEVLSEKADSLAGLFISRIVEGVKSGEGFYETGDSGETLRFQGRVFVMRDSILVDSTYSPLEPVSIVKFGSHEHARLLHDGPAFPARDDIVGRKGSKWYFFTSQSTEEASLKIDKLRGDILGASAWPQLDYVEDIAGLICEAYRVADPALSDGSESTPESRVTSQRENFSVLLFLFPDAVDELSALLTGFLSLPVMNLAYREYFLDIVLLLEKYREFFKRNRKILELALERNLLAGLLSFRTPFAIEKESCLFVTGEKDGDVTPVVKQFLSENQYLKKGPLVEMIEKPEGEMEFILPTGEREYLCIFDGRTFVISTAGDFSNSELRKELKHFSLRDLLLDVRSISLKEGVSGKNRQVLAILRIGSEVSKTFFKVNSMQEILRKKYCQIVSKILSRKLLPRTSAFFSLLSCPSGGFYKSDGNRKKGERAEIFCTVHDGSEAGSQFVTSDAENEVGETLEILFGTLAGPISGVVEKTDEGLRLRAGFRVRGNSRLPGMKMVSSGEMKGMKFLPFDYREKLEGRISPRLLALMKGNFGQGLYAFLQKLLKTVNRKEIAGIVIQFDEEETYYPRRASVHTVDSTFEVMKGPEGEWAVYGSFSGNEGIFGRVIEPGKESQAGEVSHDESEKEVISNGQGNEICPVDFEVRYRSVPKGSLSVRGKNKAFKKGYAAREPAERSLQEKVNFLKKELLISGLETALKLVGPVARERKNIIEIFLEDPVPQGRGRNMCESLLSIIFGTDEISLSYELEER